MTSRQSHTFPNVRAARLVRVNACSFRLTKRCRLWSGLDWRGPTFRRPAWGPTRMLNRGSRRRFQWKTMTQVRTTSRLFNISPPTNMTHLRRVLKVRASHGSPSSRYPLHDGYNELGIGRSMGRKERVWRPGIMGLGLMSQLHAWKEIRRCWFLFVHWIFCNPSLDALNGKRGPKIEGAKDKSKINCALLNTCLTFPTDPPSQSRTII